MVEVTVTSKKQIKKKIEKGNSIASVAFHLKFLLKMHIFDNFFRVFNWHIVFGRISVYFDIGGPAIFLR